MPKYAPLEAQTKTFSVTGIVGNVAGWQNGQDYFDSGEVFTIARRNVANGQTTRKSTVRLNRPLVDRCETTCTNTSRGNLLLALDVTSSVKSSQEEREEAYDTMVELLQDPAVRSAVVNNESFYS